MALEAILSGEQAYYQKAITGGTPSYTDDLTRLNIDLSRASARWDFSVHDVTPLGFVAEARGRDQTETANIVVSLRYVRGQPPVWSVKHGPKPKWDVGDPRAGYVAQAEGALGAIITAEQFYYQRSVGGTPSYTDDLTQLSIDLSDLTYRWAFSVYDATPLGFVAEARGHDQPEAANIIVSVRYVRGQSPVWSVEYTDAGRKHRGRT